MNAVWTRSQLTRYCGREGNGPALEPGPLDVRRRTRREEGELLYRASDRRFASPQTEGERPEANDQRVTCHPSHSRRTGLTVGCRSDPRGSQELDDQVGATRRREAEGLDGLWYRLVRPRADGLAVVEQMAGKEHAEQRGPNDRKTETHLGKLGGWTRDRYQGRALLSRLQVKPGWMSSFRSQRACGTRWPWLHRPGTSTRCAAPQASRRAACRRS
jgi:hypothetical protein